MRVREYNRSHGTTWKPCHELTIILCIYQFKSVSKSKNILKCFRIKKKDNILKSTFKILKKKRHLECLFEKHLRVFFFKGKIILLIQTCNI